MNIAVKMTNNGFDTVFESLLLDNKELVPASEAHTWLLENIVGNITKEKLEN